MNDLHKDLANKLLKLLDNKQFATLQFEVEMLGDVEKQHPLIKLYYASSIYLDKTSKNKDLLIALNLFHQIYINNKNDFQALYNMIAVSLKTNVFKDILPLAVEAYQKNKSDVKLIEGLARIHFSIGNIKESIELFKLLYQIVPEKLDGRLQFVASLNYSSEITQEEYLEECLSYTRLIEKKLNIKNDDFNFSSNKNNKIKIAFLSSDLKMHSVSFFLKDNLAKINKDEFEINLISNLKLIHNDSMSKDLKKKAKNWHDVNHYSDTELTNFLRSLNLDILIDLSGFTRGNRLSVLVRRCAKFQIGWLGYNNSLGIKNLDYLISDHNLIKKHELNLYNEKILFLPKIWNSLTPPKILPEINNDIRKKKLEFTFCSFNNFQKLSDRTIVVWSEILKVTNSKILLKNPLIAGEDLKTNILKKFLNNGVKKWQLVFLNRENNITDHLKLYNNADVALDTFPYPGVTTSFEALLMGLPVLTMKGFNFNSRCGESINKNINMEHLIAQDEQDYVNKASSLSSKNNLFEIYGENLRHKVLSSPLFDTENFTKDFEKLLKKVNIQN